MNRREQARELAAYLACGLAATAASWAAMLLANRILFNGTDRPDGFQSAVIGAANWTAGMLSAYVLNRKIVFRSDAPVRHEFPAYAASRAWTLLADQACRQAMVMAGFGLWATSAAAQVLVTVLNYAIGKLWVFRKKPGEGA